MSALGTFLEAKKLKPASLLAASRRLESRTPADRELAVQRRVAKAAAKGEKKEAGPAIAKPRSGRAITKKMLDAALAGAAVSRRVRAKLLRAAAALLEKAKEPAPTMKDLFGEEKAKVGAVKGPAKKKE